MFLYILSKKNRSFVPKIRTYIGLPICIWHLYTCIFYFVLQVKGNSESSKNKLSMFSLQFKESYFMMDAAVNAEYLSNKLRASI